MSRRIGLAVILIISVLLLYNLGQQIYNSLLASKRLDQEASQLSQLRQENEQLQKQAEEVKSKEFIENQARNKLGMSREGETVVIISQDELTKALDEGKVEPKVAVPNWQGWLRLFFD